MLESLWSVEDDRSEEVWAPEEEPNPINHSEEIRRVNAKASRKRRERACDCVLKVRYLASDSVSQVYTLTTSSRSLLTTFREFVYLNPAAMGQQMYGSLTSLSSFDVLQLIWDWSNEILPASSRKVSGKEYVLCLDRF